MNDTVRVYFLMFYQYFANKAHDSSGNQYAHTTLYTIQVPNSRGTTYNSFSGLFLLFFKNKFVCFVVAVFDLVHDVETIFPLPHLLTVSENLF